MRSFGEAPPDEAGLFARLKKGLAKSSGGLGASLSGLLTKEETGCRHHRRAGGGPDRRRYGPERGQNGWPPPVAKNRYDSEVSEAELRALLAGEITAALKPLQRALIPDDSKKPFVILVAGVNGTGKTTTIGKLARLPLRARTAKA